MHVEAARLTRSQPLDPHDWLVLRGSAPLSIIEGSANREAQPELQKLSWR